MSKKQMIAKTKTSEIAGAVAILAGFFCLAISRVYPVR
jgi:hypothetical protein